jgi:fatty acyl-CoA reductase
MIHAAATIKFDENLKLAIDINVHGTKDVIELGKEMKQLKVSKNCGLRFF